MYTFATLNTDNYKAGVSEKDLHIGRFCIYNNVHSRLYPCRSAGRDGA